MQEMAAVPRWHGEPDILDEWEERHDRWQVGYSRRFHEEEQMNLLLPSVVNVENPRTTCKESPIDSVKRLRSYSTTPQATKSKIYMYRELDTAGGRFHQNFSPVRPGLISWRTDLKRVLRYLIA